ncbi:hypothetical protein QSV34_08230 [Porticoccus sp. W117]|uniref:hypothetical protein n=1 Tax=Porticoccus sp. W117 TaxID=3054777 RepID=UPI0025953ACC|nr:hypothetical protein [Porticoccus sp. W117]MDM3871341.1 hypothetical protein [Porticoccus sp. W117]
MNNYFFLYGIFSVVISSLTLIVIPKILDKGDNLSLVRCLCLCQLGFLILYLFIGKGIVFSLGASLLMTFLVLVGGIAFKKIKSWQQRPK